MKSVKVAAPETEIPVRFITGYRLGLPPFLQKLIENRAQKIAVEQTSDQWDWPLQEASDGLAHVCNDIDKWEVGLDVSFFSSEEIEITLRGRQIFVHCYHEEDSSDKFGPHGREVNRGYKLPNDVDTATVSAHFAKKGGILRIRAKKMVKK